MPKPAFIVRKRWEKKRNLSILLMGGNCAEEKISGPQKGYFSQTYKGKDPLQSLYKHPLLSEIDNSIV